MSIDLLWLVLVVITSWTKCQPQPQSDVFESGSHAVTILSRFCTFSFLDHVYDFVQAILDRQAQFAGDQVKEKDDEDDEVPILLPERLAVLDALFRIHCPSPENERARRVAAIEAMMALGKLQDGHQYLVRHRRREAATAKLEPVTVQAPGVCKPRQCFFCVARLTTMNPTAKAIRRNTSFAVTPMAPAARMVPAARTGSSTAGGRTPYEESIARHAVHMGHRPCVEHMTPGHGGGRATSHV
jgi:hypothetical protein